MQVRVRLNMVPSVPYVDRSRAAAGASAFYGERLRDIVFGDGGTVAFENELVRSSSRKTFIWGWIWI